MQEKLWTKDFVLLSMASFFMYLVFYCIMVVVAVYVLQQMAASNAEAGLAAGDFLLAALIARLFAGHSIERIGARRMMLWGLFLYGVVQGLYLIVPNVYLFMAVRFLHGGIFGFCATAVSTLAAQLVPKSRQSEGMGYFLLSTTLATAVGPFIGLYVYHNHGFSYLLMVSAGMAFLSFLLAKMIQPVAGAGQPVSRQTAAHGWSSYFEVKALPIAMISFVIYFCYSSLLSFFSAYVSELDMMDEGQYFFIVYSLAIICSRPQVGKMADRKGISCVMYPSFACFALGLYFLSQMHTLGIMFLAAALCGFGFGTFAAMGQVIAIQKVPAERFGIALSTVLSIAELGTGFGPFLLGGLIGVWGFHWLYRLAAVLVIFCGLAYYFCRKKNFI